MKDYAKQLLREEEEKGTESYIKIVGILSNDSGWKWSITDEKQISHHGPAFIYTIDKNIIDTPILIQEKNGQEPLNLYEKSSEEIRDETTNDILGVARIYSVYPETLDSSNDLSGKEFTIANHSNGFTVKNWISITGKCDNFS